MSPLTSSPLRLTTFGGLALVGASDRPLGAAAGQRRPLAVLALLAASGEAGLSRERLAGILWSEAEPERSRRSLAQTLYSLRRATGHEELVLGSTDLRLNRAVVFADVVEFDQALRDGRLPEAVELYAGPFLDGVQLAGGDAFERWADGERQRHARRCADALRRLGREAARERDVAAEVAWARRLVAIDPVDASSALALVDALGRAGDLAGAQRAARVHEALVRQELELPLAPAIRDRLAELQREHDARVAATAPPPAPAPSRPAPVVLPPVVAGPLAPVVEDAPAPVAPTHEGRTAPASVPGGRPWWDALLDRYVPSLRPVRWVRIVNVGAVAALLILYGAAIGQRVIGRPALVEAAPVGRSGVVAVLPFSTAATDSSLVYLGAGSADLMARLLDGDVGPRAVDPGAVVAALERSPAPVPSVRDGATLAQGVALGQRLGVAEVVLGRVAGTPQRLTLSARLVDVASGDERADAEVSGPVDSLPALVDVLTARLVAGREAGGDRARALASASLPTLRPFLRAEAAAHASRFQEAVVLYERALERDSAFAPAALGLAIAADRLNGAEPHDRALALAWAARDRLSEQERAYLVALAGPRYPEPSSMSEHVAAWERAVALSPERAAAWSELGEHYFYEGALLGVRNPEQRARAAFARALARDPSDARAHGFMAELAVRRGDQAALARLAASPELRAAGELADYLSWRVAAARRDVATLASLRARLAGMSGPSLRAIAVASQHDALLLDDGGRALQQLEARAALAGEQVDVLLAQHSLALNRGRTAEALEVTERLRDAQPGGRAHLRLRVLDALYGGGDVAAAARAATELARAADGPLAAHAAGRAEQLADVCALAQWRLAQGDAPDTRAAVRRAIALLRGAGVPRVPVTIGAAPRGCGDLLTAMLAVRTGAPEAREQLAALDARMLTGPALGDASTYATLARARLHEQLGDPAAALAAVRQRAYLKGWPRYLATALDTEARLAAATGDAAGARRASALRAALRATP